MANSNSVADPKYANVYETDSGAKYASVRPKRGREVSVDLPRTASLDNVRAGYVDDVLVLLYGDTQSGLTGHAVDTSDLEREGIYDRDELAKISKRKKPDQLKDDALILAIADRFDKVERKAKRSENPYRGSRFEHEGEVARPEFEHYGEAARPRWEEEWGRYEAERTIPGPGRKKKKGKRSRNPDGEVIFEGAYLVGRRSGQGMEITPTPEGVEEAKELMSGDGSFGYEELFEDWLDSEWIWIPPEEIGAMTDAPILSRDAFFEDDGSYRLDPGGEVFWHANYMVEDLLEKWSKGHKVLWHGARNVDVKPSLSRKARARALNPFSPADAYIDEPIPYGTRLRTIEEMIFVIGRDEVTIGPGVGAILACEFNGEPMLYFPEIDMSWHPDADENTPSEWCDELIEGVPVDAFLFHVPDFDHEELEDDARLVGTANFWRKFQLATPGTASPAKSTRSAPRKKASRKSRARKLNKGKIRIDRKGYCVEPTTYERGGHTVERSGYCVKPSSFLIDDPGRPGRRSRGAEKGPYREDPKWVQRKGKLGGPGYTKKTDRQRHAILNKCVKEYGYRSCLGSLQVLLRNSEISPKVRKTLKGDIAWLKDKYGGPGSFGSERKRKKKRKQNPMHRDPGLEEYSVEDLEEMDTIGTSQDADLKVDTGTHRWWLSRLGPEDGETHQVHVEEYVHGADGGRWAHVHSYAPFIYAVDQYGEPRTVRRLKNDLMGY